MNKLFRGIICGGCAAALFIGAGMLSACGPENEKKLDDGEKEEDVFYTVTFETNGGSEVQSQEVKEGEFAVQPEDPEKADYIFDGWYKEEALTTDFVFENEAITADTTVYAGWLSATGTETSTATFYWNYEGAPDGGVYEVKEFAAGGKLRKPADPKRDGYTFAGWYMDEACTEEFVNNTVYEGDQSIYARWLLTYTFEAENAQLTGFEPEEDYTVNMMGQKIGYGFSSNLAGIGLIGSDTAASGGKAVRGLYYEGAYLDFEFTSDRAETGVSLSIRVAAEFREITLTQDTFQITVNGGSPVSYRSGAITIDGSEYADGHWDGAGSAHEYTEVVINNIDIQQGENVIRLYVNNSQGIEGAGTVQAMAPIIDCIKLRSSAELEMNIYENK